MAESVCTGDCLDVDGNGRIIVVPDAQTIVCESDGNGGTHLVAKSLDCDAWPFTCSPATGGRQVYCSDNNLYVQKPYYEQGHWGESNTDSAIFSKLRGPVGTTIAEGDFDLTNNDPCGRSLCVQILLNWNKHSIGLDPGEQYEFNYEYSVDGGTNWVTISDTFNRNVSNENQLFSSGGNTTHVVNITLSSAETQNIRMRMVTGTYHNPSQSFTGTTANSIYAFFADWTMRSDCN